ncbi:hypothetical protein CGCTS75_v006804 [Colletotrichum tropicale]|nr:hypothetical protein CGCTS75_v006804 [Colletotrichum tropicale]
MTSDESDLYDSDSEPGVATRTHHGPKSVQFDLSSSPSQFPEGFPRRRPSSRSHHRHRSTERPPNPFAPASAPFPVPGSRARPMPPHVQTQNLPQFSRSMGGNPFSPNPVDPSPPYYSYPSAAGYNYPPGQYPNSAPPRPPSSGHHRSNPFDPSPRSYTDRESPYYGIPVPSQPQPIPRYEGRTPSRPKPRPIQPQSVDMEHVQRTMSNLLEREKARERQAMEAAQRERDIAVLSREMDRKMKLGFGEIRNELFQNDLNSEPGPPRSEYAMRMYSTPARSVDDRTYWAGRPGAPPPDLNQQEMDQLWEGRRQLDPKYANRVQGRQDPRLEFDRRSSFSSRLDPEQMQRAIQAGVEVALSELDNSYGAPSPLSQRPASTVYGTSPTARRHSQQMWPNGMYRAETMEPRSSPFAPPSPVEQRRAFDRHAADNPQTEAEWVGRPRPRRRTEGMNITVQRSGAPGRSASHRDKPRSRPEIQMSGGRGPTYQDVGASTAVVRRIPADQVGPRRLYPNGYREPYFEEDTDSDESNAQTLARYPPPPVPDPPR